MNRTRRPPLRGSKLQHTPSGLPLSRLGEGLGVRARQSEQGLTLVEALITVVITTIIVVMMTPPMLLAVATRINLRKTEQGIQLAQRVIENVRTDLNTDQDELPPCASSGSPCSSGSLATSAVPSTFTPSDSTNQCKIDPANATTAKGCNIDGDVGDEFFVQVFRVGDMTSGGGDLIGFEVGVRIYSKEAQGTLSSGLGEDADPGLEKDTASTLFTGGLGSRETHPVAVVYTEINRGDVRGALDSY